MICDSNCEGCYMYKRCICDKHNDVDMVCPCSICLVKVVCNGSCDLYKKFIDKVQSSNSVYQYISIYVKNICIVREEE